VKLNRLSDPTTQSPTVPSLEFLPEGRLRTGRVLTDIDVGVDARYEATVWGHRRTFKTKKALYSSFSCEHRDHCLTQPQMYLARGKVARGLHKIDIVSGIQLSASDRMQAARDETLT
jgi:hypothetical protein